jgi:hypothetical protein
MKAYASLAVLAVAVLAGCISLSTLTAKDCGQDIDCLSRAAASCENARATAPGPVPIYMEVRGCEDGKAVMYFNWGIGSATCKYPLNETSNASRDYNSKYCTIEGIGPSLGNETQAPPQGTAPSGDVVIKASTDDWAWSYRPDVNRHHDQPGVRYKTTNGERAEPLFKFDVSSLRGKEIQSVDLFLYVRDIQSAPEEIEVFSVDDDSWSEGSVTWNNAPPSKALLGSAFISSPMAWYRWDVSEFVRKQAAGDGVASFRVVSPVGYPGDNSIGFNDRTTGQPPTLAVTLGRFSCASDIECGSGRRCLRGTCATTPLKLVFIPMNWDSGNAAFEQEARKQYDYLIDKVPLRECPDSASFTPFFEDCRVEVTETTDCNRAFLEDIWSKCSAGLPQVYDYVVAVTDKDYFSTVELNFQDILVWENIAGCSSIGKNPPLVFIEKGAVETLAHEFGHQWNFTEQYYKPWNGWPNPLESRLGCDPNSDCCDENGICKGNLNPKNGRSIMAYGGNPIILGDSGAPREFDENEWNWLKENVTELKCLS